MKAAAVIPAYQSEDSIGETVTALVADGRLDEVIVADDGSTDLTGEMAERAGARVVRLEKNLGMGGAIEAGFDATDAEIVLIVDGDTRDTARSAIDLIEPIARGEADVVIGILPTAGSRGGFGTVVRAARWLIYRASGFDSKAPLSGQRAVLHDVFDSCRPLAPRYGANPAFTADSAAMGFRILEQPVDMDHRHYGRTLSGFAHRAVQGWDLVRALVP
ncbi:MAG: glycosyltransferase family 2 protein, partial [Actinomycetota bacterium]